MRNKWKIAFWVCLLLFFTVGIVGAYLILEQGATICDLKEGYADTEADMRKLIIITEEASLTRFQIEEVIKKQPQWAGVDLRNDTVSLDRLNLIFEKDSLRKIEKRW